MRAAPATLALASGVRPRARRGRGIAGAAALSIALALLGACLGPGAPLPEAQAKSDALAVLDQMAAGRWTAVRSRFDSTMMRDLSADELANAWNKVEAADGTYGGHGQPRVTVSSELAIVDVDTTFGATTVDYRITFDPNGQIAGLYLLRA